MTPEEREVWNRTYYARNRQRLRVAGLRNYHIRKAEGRVDVVAQAAYYKQWRAKNPEKARKSPEAALRAHQVFMFRYRNDPKFHDKICAKNRKTTPRRRHGVWRNKIMKKYGITQADYDTMFAKQEGRCAICKTDKDADPRGRRFPNIDHCHKTGRVRGLLCTKCNRGLGLFNDDPAKLLSAVAYLRQGLTEQAATDNP